MPTFAQLSPDFFCPHQHGCPYLEGLSTQFLWEHYQKTALQEGQYEYQLESYREELRQSHQRNRALEKKVEQLQAQMQALHRRQFKGRRKPKVRTQDAKAAAPKRGAPVGHPPWQREPPKKIDEVIPVPAPSACPHCQQKQLLPCAHTSDHLQEDIVLQPRTVVSCYRHQLAWCPSCACEVSALGPGELAGAYIGPATKATATYLRYEMHVSYRKICRFFSDVFGLKFVPASAYGFDCQATRRGLALYEDLRQKIRSLPLAHADETSWRHEGQNYWVWYAGNQDIALFQLDAHRSAEAAQSLLGENFRGILVADAFGSYHPVHPKDWQSCLAHLKKKAKELGEEVALLRGKARNPHSQRFCRQVQGWVKEACQIAHLLQGRAWRAGVASKKQRSLRRKLLRICARPLCYARAESFRKRLLGPEQKHFFTFLRYPEVPPTNNQAERSLRPIVILRKVVQCTRSEKGLENHSVLQSLKETARRQGRGVRQFLFDLHTQNTRQAQASLYAKSANNRLANHRC